MPRAFFIMKNKSYYFSHDYNAANDTKVLFLRHQLGMEGYGIYWFLIERLAEAGGKMPLELIPILSMQMQSTDVKVKGVITQFDLFTIEEGEFWSERLQEHLGLREKLSQSGKNGAANRWANGGAIGEANANKRKEKEIKVKESKIKEIKEKEINIDFEWFWDFYDKRVGNKEKLKKKWENLNDEERQKAMNFIEIYKIARPDKQFRQNPETFLNKKSWNDEVISNNQQPKVAAKITDQQLHEAFIKRNSEWK